MHRQERSTSGPVYLREEWADPFREGCAAGRGIRVGQADGRDDARRLPEAARDAVGGLPLVYGLWHEIWGDGQQDRNFTYIGDFVDGMIRAAETIDDGSPVNIGRAEHIKIIDMVRLIFAEIGFEPEVIEFDTSNACGRLQPRRGPRPRAGAARLGIQDDLRRRAPSHNPLVLRDTQCLGGGLPAWGAAHEALKHCGEVRSF